MADSRRHDLRFINSNRNLIPSILSDRKIIQSVWIFARKFA